MPAVKFVDTTLRDGQQSLWAMNMRTRHMVPALPSMDAAGFDQMELMAPGAAFKKFVRHHREDPWEWVRAAVKGVRRTTLRWHGRFEGSSLSGGMPPEVGELMIAKVVALGIHYTRIGDNWNRIAGLRDKKERLERIGMTPTINVMYSVSQRHTDDYFIERARQAASIQPYRICLKDVGGLLTPERTRALLPKLMAETGDIPWEFHGHCNNGLGPLNALEAVKVGVRYVHTAVPPLANGTSQPSIYNVARNLRALGYDAPVDLEALEPARAHLMRVARQEGFPVGQPLEYRERQYSHQIPGGMISNLIYQLQLAGLGDRVEETLDEAARVRADFGYPIMVTPLSQFVGSQAAINVILGERYKQVSDDVIHYAWGRHGGEEAVSGMDPEVRAKILDRPRARELEHYEQPQPTLAELRQRYGPVSDEELILRAIVGDDAADVLGNGREHPPHRRPGGTAADLGQLLESVLADTGLRYFSVRSPGGTVTLQRGSSSGS